MSQFDQFANQGGPAAEDADALAEARRVTDEQLRNADYSVDLPEPLGAERQGGDDLTAGDPDAGSAGDPDAASAEDLDAASAGKPHVGPEGDAEAHARRLLDGAGGAIDDAPVDADRAEAAERSDD